MDNSMISPLINQRLSSVNSRLVEYYVAGSRVSGMSPVRRFFCLFVTFDLLFTGLLWLMCLVTTGNPLIAGIENEVLRYSIYTSIFDIVMLAGSRFILLLLAYALCHINHWWTVAVTTLVSSSLLVTKVFFYQWEKSESNTTFSVVLLLCSFILAWSEVWLLDSRVIPREQQALDIQNKFFPNERTPLLVDDDLQSNAGNQSTFYSPVGTPPGERNNEEENVRRFREMEEYRRMADEALEVSYSTMKSSGWEVEQSLSNGDRILSKKNPSNRKSYKFVGIIQASPKVVFDELFANVEESPSWNRSVINCKVIKRFDEFMDITYHVAAEGGGGLVSSRDFVDLRSWEKRGKDFITTGVSITFPERPPVKEYVRGENGPCGFIMESLPANENSCELHWLLNTDLKGWLPQYLIDQTLASVMLDYIKHLRDHLANNPSFEVYYDQ